mgnify:FL=1
MKKGNEIKDVLKKLKDDNMRKDDYIVPLKSFEVLSTDRYPKLLISERIDSSSGIELNMNDHSIGHLCNKLEIGTSYIRKCLPYPALVEHNLNHWIENTKNKNLMVRTMDDTARAILSDRYKRIDNDLVANKTLSMLIDMKAELKYCSYNGDQLNLTATLPKLKGEVKEGDLVTGGVTITNCEVGTSSLKVQPFVYRLVCTNGMVVPEYLGTFLAKHVGKKLETPEEDDQGIIVVEKMLDKLQALSDPKVFEDILGDMRYAQSQHVQSYEIVKLAKTNGLSDWERAEIFTRLDKVYGDVFTTDRYELGNAITNLANSDDVTDDRARFLQELGGTVMFWNTPNYARN